MKRTNLIFCTLCVLAYLSISEGQQQRPINPECLVKGLCSSDAPPVYASTDGGKTCKTFGNICFHKDEWCQNDYNGLPELKLTPKENCGSFI